MKILAKYDDRSDEGIFLGYATNSKGYRCYNKRLHKLVDCINVKVDEEIPVRNIRSDEQEQKIQLKMKMNRSKDQKEKSLDQMKI